MGSLCLVLTKSLYLLSEREETIVTFCASCLVQKPLVQNLKVLGAPYKLPTHSSLYSLSSSLGQVCLEKVRDTPAGLFPYLVLGELRSVEVGKGSGRMRD